MYKKGYIDYSISPVEGVGERKWYLKIIKKCFYAKKQKVN